MTRERLQSISLSELEQIAHIQGIDIPIDSSRQFLIEMIVDAFNENKRDRELQNNLSILGEERKYDIARDEEFALTDADTYDLPLRYNETCVVFMVRDPNWAFAYWDIEDQQVQGIKGSDHFEQLLLRVYDVELVDFDGTNAHSFFDIPIQFEDMSW